MLNNEDGIELARLLEKRHKISKLWRFPNSGGITPAKQFYKFYEASVEMIFAMGSKK